MTSQPSQQGDAKLKQPDAQIIPTYILRNPAASPGERRMLLVDHPDELRCVAVMLGEHTVFLPGIFRPLTCQQLAEVFASRRNADDKLNVSLNGTEMPWPNGRRTSWIGRKSHLAAPAVCLHSPAAMAPARPHGEARPWGEPLRVGKSLGRARGRPGTRPSPSAGPSRRAAADLLWCV